MRLSTRTRYGTRAMLELARHPGEGHLSLGQIAERQGISAKYLESLFNMLRNAGLVHSLRGPQGGYTLARPPERITLRDLYEAFEGSEGFVACGQTPDHCARSDNCITREVWLEFYEDSLRSLERISLADLARRAEDEGQASYLDYAI